MYTDSVDHKLYDRLMEEKKRLAAMLHTLEGSSEYRRGERVEKARNLFKNGLKQGFENAFDIIGERKNRKKLLSMVDIPVRKAPVAAPDYYSDHRIAVYTCIFGKYDHINEPLCVPDNVDYYIITDMEAPENSVWKKLDISGYPDRIRSMGDVEKNRWFKMHPHLVFPDHRYSVYIDGNILPVTDFTELINRISDRSGVAMFWHKYNNCVYEEALFNNMVVKKVPQKEVDRQVRYLKTKGMPEKYGMTTCNVIARDHGNEMCKKLMNDWWSEFIRHCRRDQLSFPYVLWKNGVKFEDVATLGASVWDSDILFVMSHNGR